MSRWRDWLERGFEGLDTAFDAVANLLRVLIRGKFRPDGKSFRGGAFAEIVPKEMLLQELTLNAEDAVQARRIVALEPDRYLALEPEVSVFDVAGPMETGETAVEGGQRSYLLGVTRKDILEQIRTDASAGFLVSIEAFAFHPPDYPDLVLVFRDTAGDRQRRARRVLLLVAALALAWSAASAFDAWTGALAGAELRAQTEEADAQRQIRIEERQLLRTRAALAQFDASGAPSLASALETLAIVARRQPVDAELTSLAWTPQKLILEGRSYTPANAELELRRGFEKDPVDFVGQPSGAPAPFTATLTLAAETTAAPTPPPATGPPDHTTAPTKPPAAAPR